MISIAKTNTEDDWIRLALGIYEKEYKQWLEDGYFIKINDTVYTELSPEFLEDLYKEKVWDKLKR